MFHAQEMPMRKTLAVTVLVDGGTRCWGYNFWGQVGNNSTVDAKVPAQVSGLWSGARVVAVGQGHACALVDGAVQCWGRNAEGQLGNGTTTESHVPVLVGISP
jgi:alpha-tubulin suppressor-like RCC1 family protein